MSSFNFSDTPFNVIWAACYKVGDKYMMGIRALPVEAKKDYPSEPLTFFSEYEKVVDAKAHLNGVLSMANNVNRLHIIKDSVNATEYWDAFDCDKQLEVGQDNYAFISIDPRYVVWSSVHNVQIGSAEAIYPPKSYWVHCFDLFDEQMNREFSVPVCFSSRQGAIDNFYGLKLAQTRSHEDLGHLELYPPFPGEYRLVRLDVFQHFEFKSVGRNKVSIVIRPHSSEDSVRLRGSFDGWTYSRVAVIDFESTPVTGSAEVAKLLFDKELDRAGKSIVKPCWQNSFGAYASWSAD